MKVSAVVPAYNEEATIGDVVSTVAQVPLIDEVVVVSDGSVDGTAEVARKYGAKVIEMAANVGKGAAMKEGVLASDGDIILFVDADLIGLTGQHITDLLRPVLSGEADATVGLFERGRIATDLAQVVAPFLSGQRAVRREFLKDFWDQEVAGFEVEVALTRCLKKKGARVTEVVLGDLTQRMKEEKLGVMRGFLARMKMYWEILRFAQRRSHR